MDKKLRAYIRKRAPFIDFDKKFLFFPNDKVGHRSSLYVIGQYCVILTRGCKRNYMFFFDRLTDRNIDSMFKYTIVRNPWDRVVSCFHYLQVQGQIPNANINLVGCSGHFIDPSISFNEFVMKTLLTNGIKTNQHFHEQHPNILFKNKCYLDFVAHLETIENDWKYISAKISVFHNFPHANTSKHDHYTSYYTDESKAIINKLYKKDIELLNYKYGG